jgi:flagellin-like hook-associated protein FlgL
MNARYGENFVFAGADGLNVPFVWEENDDGSRTLTYRGISVDTTVPDVFLDGNGDKLTINANGEVDTAGTNYIDATKVELVEAAPTLANDLDASGDQNRYDADGTANPTDGAYYKAADGSYVSISDYEASEEAKANALKDATNPTDAYELTKDGKTYYIVPSDTDYAISKDDYDTAEKNMTALNYMSTETKYADLGLGMQEDEDGNIIGSSVANIALQGINFLGYGVDEDGDPKNIVSIVDRMGTILQNCDVDSGAWASDDEREEFYRLAGKFEDAAALLTNKHTELDTQASFYQSNQKQLESTAYTLEEQFLDIEDVDAAEAISSYSWAQYCYNTALKVGNSILSQSLMDYIDT